MEPCIRVFLLDTDVRSRAAVSYRLSGDGIHVEPYEDILDLPTNPHSGGVILVHDEGDLLARLKAHLEVTENFLPIVAFSADPEIGRAVRAIRAGAIDYIPFPADRDAIMRVISEAQDYARPQLAAHQRSVAARHCVKRLTDREREVLNAVAHGLSNRTIAEKLGISPRTVEIHRANMLTKMTASTSPEAVRIAQYAGMWN